MESKTELKPCPFCGGNNIELRYGYSYGRPNFHGKARCLDCNAVKHSLLSSDTEEEAYQAAAAAWNRRANNEQS